ncbi:uncharacterized protein [Periplaneta americana]|uniref:uncharacterized protein isoform X2 n=1 Tax=Periplaneta americana TaxID=6978 RepID=UPI0037E716A3
MSKQGTAVSEESKNAVEWMAKNEVKRTTLPPLKIERQQSSSSIASAASTVDNLEPLELDKELDKALKLYMETTTTQPVADPITAQLSELRQRLQLDHLLLQSTKSHLQNISFDMEKQRLDKMTKGSVGDVLVEPKEEKDSMDCDPGILQLQEAVTNMVTVLKCIQKTNTSGAEEHQETKDSSDSKK